MTRKTELEEDLPKCFSADTVESFDEIDEGDEGLEVVLLPLPERIDDCESSINGASEVAKARLAFHALLFHDCLQALDQHTVEDFTRDIEQTNPTPVLT